MNTAALAQSAFHLENLLGGRRVLASKPKNPLDWVRIVRQGLGAAAADTLAQSLQLTQAELAAVVGIPERTLLRRKKEGAFTSDESAKLLRLARAAERAAVVFESAEAARHWLKSPNAALGRVTPLSLLDTEFGAEGVMDCLGRIEHGVFA